MLYSIQEVPVVLERPIPTEPTHADTHPSIVAAIDRGADQFRRLLIALVVSGLPSTPGELLALEKDAHARVAKECLDPVMGECIRAAHEEPAVVVRAAALVNSMADLRPQNASERVSVTLLGGSRIEIRTPYFLRRPLPKSGRRRARGRRGAEGNGMYPMLAVLGVLHHATPALTSEVARLVAISTEAEAHETLALRGVYLGRKVVSRLAKRFARRGLEYRAWKQERTQSGYLGTGVVTGRRLVIGTDGGRVRLREPRKRGRRSRTGHRRFDAPWREPKVLIVYEIDERGRKLQRGLVRYDATMQDADGIFSILASLLREIGAHEAAEWIVVGDGADWIWERVPQLIQDVGYDPEKVTEVVDFYHSVQRLHANAAEQKGWTEGQRQDWVKTMRRRLKRGQVQAVIDEAVALCRGRRTKSVKNLPNYFVNHRRRMRYAECLRRGIPLGSGAVESCVRRTINLRMKGNGIFWLQETAEGLLHMRAQVLCGRWKQHVIEVLEPKALWKLPALSGSRESASM